MVPALLDLIGRKGVDRVVDVLINWNPGWSWIGKSEGITNYLGPGRARFVSDYGLAYTREEQPMDSFITSEDSDALWIEYVYIIGPKSLTVLESYATDEVETKRLVDGAEYDFHVYKHRLLETIRYDHTLIGV
jgi:hypothetical protein